MEGFQGTSCIEARLVRVNIVRFCQCRSQGNCPLSFHQFCVHMNVNTSKFEVNLSLERFHMSFTGKKEVLLASYSQQKTEFFTK